MRKNTHSALERTGRDILLDILAQSGMFYPVAAILKNKQVAMVYQTVYHGSRHLVIREGPSPLGEFWIGRQYQTFLS